MRPLWRHPGRIIAIAVLVVLVGFIVVLATRPNAEDRLVRSPLVGKPAPDIDGTSLAGSAFHLTTERGRWVLVNFFATWCIPCQQEQPQLVSLSLRHAAGNDLQLVSIVFNDDATAVKNYMAKNGGDWPVLADATGALAVDYGVARVPESYLIGPDGVVRGKFIGIGNADAVDQAIRTLEQSG